jgi:hypothetical protein
VINRKPPIKATKKLQRVNIDFWGPYHILTYNGYLYILTKLDEATKESSVTLCKSRAEAFNDMRHWKARVELQTACKILNIRCDNTAEFQKLKSF